MGKMILLVEDHQTTREGIEEYFTVKGYDVTAVCNGDKAIEAFEKAPFDVVVLDIMLPKRDGFSVLKWIRKHSETPVLMLTAMDDESTQIMSFDGEADDYMSKPFSLAVLEKRVEALLRRGGTNHPKDIWIYEDTTVDFAGYRATYKGKEAGVKPKELALLRVMIEHAGQVLTREQILDHLYSHDEAPIDRVVDVYIKNLRKKLHLTCIKTVKGVGYKYEEIV